MKHIKALGTLASIIFFIIAIIGSLQSHHKMTVNHDTIPYERNTGIPTLVELTPEPDYAAQPKPECIRYNPYVYWTEEEKEILIQIAQSEAGNQGTVGMALVMRVVLNRVEKNGTDIRTEVFADGQFATDGMAPGTWETYEALDMVQTGWNESDGALYFCADGWNYYGKEHLFRYGGHWFSR